MINLPLDRRSRLDARGGGADAHALSELRRRWTKLGGDLAPWYGALRRRWRQVSNPLLVASLTATALLLLLPSGFYEEFRGGVDPHWHLALWVAFRKGLVFGKDIVFTYGPLGFLEGRPEVAGIKHTLMLWDFALYACVGVVLYRIFASLSTGLERTTAFLCAVAIGVTHGAVGTQLLLPLELYALCTHFNQPRRRAIWLGVALLCGIANLFVKVNTGIIALGLLFAYLLYRAATERRARPVAEAGLSFALVAAAFVMLRVSPWGYLRASWEFIRGYTDAMGRIEHRSAYSLLVALFLLATFAASLLAHAGPLLARRRELAQVLVAFGALMIYFKQGFVRLDASHVAQFFELGMLPAAFVYLYVSAEVKRALRPYLAFAAAASVAPALPSLDLDSLTARYEGTRVYLREATSWKDRAPAVSAKLSHFANLPRSFADKIGRGSVDFMPHEAATAWSHQLDYRPCPVFQSYAAFTPYLDELNAAFLRSEAAPQFVVYLHEGLSDRRYAPWWSAPRTKLALFTDYDAHALEGGRLLLERRGRPRALVEGRRWPGRARLGEALPIPRSAGLVVLSARVRRSFHGNLRHALYRASALTLDVRSGSHATSAPVVAAHLEDGLLVNRVLEKIEQVQALFAGPLDGVPEADRATVSAEDPADYRDRFEYEFRELLLPSDSNPE